MRRVKPLNDFIFKKLFGEKGNEDILLSFLNAVLNRTQNVPLTQIEIIENKELSKELIEDKMGIIDVRAKTLTGEQIDIEVQLSNQGNMEKRTLFYWSKLYTGSLKQGEDYSKLTKVITINLLDFEILGTTNYQSSFHLWEDTQKDYMLTDVVEIHFIEYPKFKRLHEKNYKDSPIQRWLGFLQNDISEATLKELITMEPAIQKAENKLEYLSSDDETMMIYLAREKSLRDRTNFINSAEKRGIERGIQQGIEQGIEQGKLDVAKNLLNLGLSIDQIIKATGLTKEQIETLMK